MKRVSRSGAELKGVLFLQFNLVRGSNPAFVPLRFCGYRLALSIFSCMG